jgi:hypothetical protein
MGSTTSNFETLHYTIRQTAGLAAPLKDFELSPLVNEAQSPSLSVLHHNLMNHLQSTSQLLQAVLRIAFVDDTLDIRHEPPFLARMESSSRVNTQKVMGRLREEQLRVGFLPIYRILASF